MAQIEIKSFNVAQQKGWSETDDFAAEHLYLVYTDDLGNKTYLRGGLEANIEK